MADVVGRLSRRSLLLSGLGTAHLPAQTFKATGIPPEWHRYADQTTELEVYRLTDPAHESRLPAYYNRPIARNSAWLLFSNDRGGSPQAFRMDLKNGEMRQWTHVEDLDPTSLTLLPDNRGFCYFAGRSLQVVALATLRARELYQIPDDWERTPGMSVRPDGTHAIFGERNGSRSRLRMVSLVQGVARTVLEAPSAITDPIARPTRAQILYRQGDQALWLVNSDGQQNRQLKLADGRVGPANWAPDGKTILYLNFPADSSQLNAIRECVPDANTDKLVAKTSQFVHFGFNRDTSVFVGASRNGGSPTVLIMLRITRRELTICEHRASHPEAVAPIFAPDSQRIYFQSDRDGKPAIYCVHVERLVEKTESETAY